jgi:hypothetical protein
MVDNGKDKYLYLYLDNESMTGYVGETKNIKNRHRQHKRDIWPGRKELVSKIGEPVAIKADFKSMTAVKFAEHATYLKYKDLGYDMLQKPPHPNIFKKYHNRVDECKICDELGCDFTKERLEYILAVHRVSKLCEMCQKPFYYDPVKHGHIIKFNNTKCCSLSCASKGRIPWCKGKKRPDHSEKMKGLYKGENNPMFGIEPWNKGKNLTEETIEKMKGPRPSLQGENNPSAVLTVKRVRMIKVMLRSDIKTVKQIAKLFNVHPSTIYSIKNGNSWPDV